MRGVQPSSEGLTFSLQTSIAALVSTSMTVTPPRAGTTEWTFSIYNIETLPELGSPGKPCHFNLRLPQAPLLGAARGFVFREPDLSLREIREAMGASDLEFSKPFRVWRDKDGGAELGGGIEAQGTTALVMRLLERCKVSPDLLPRLLHQMKGFENVNHIEAASLGIDESAEKYESEMMGKFLHENFQDGKYVGLLTVQPTDGRLYEFAPTNLPQLKPLWRSELLNSYNLMPRLTSDTAFDIAHPIDGVPDSEREAGKNRPSKCGVM